MVLWNQKIIWVTARPADAVFSNKSKYGQKKIVFKGQKKSDLVLRHYPPRSLAISKLISKLIITLIYGFLSLVSMFIACIHLAFNVL